MKASNQATKLNSILDSLAPARRRPMRFAWAAAAVALALAVTGLGQWIFGSAAVVPVACFVVLSTGMLGLAAGLCAAWIAVLALDFFFLPPIHSLSNGPEDWRIGIALSALAVAAHLAERRISARIRKEIKPPLGIHGSLDGLENGEIYGWAYDADRPDEAVQLTVFVDRHPVAEIAAVHYRPDVAETMDCSGRHGFYVDLAGICPDASGAWVDVKLSNGNSLANAPAYLALSDLNPRPPKPTVLFMHIPKTAGTAFREAIAVNFVQSEIAYVYPTPPGFLVADLRALPLEQRRGYRAVIGHYQFGMHEALPQRSEYVTVVRDPVARVLSHYWFLAEAQPELVHDADGRLLSLEEVCETRLTVDFDNAMVRCFSGVDQRDFPPGSLTREIFDRALRNLRQHFSFVGHQEESGKALQQLRRRYGWSEDTALASVNLGVRAKRADPDEKQRRVVRRYNNWDEMLYGEILQLYPRSG